MALPFEAADRPPLPIFADAARCDKATACNAT
jgi:hypothetical protein